VTYSIIWEPVAVRAWRDLVADDRPGARRVAAAISYRAADPSLAEEKGLGGSPFYRMRVADYRVLYRIDVQRKALHVVSVGRVTER
jgi:mRNA interferase RelE/StbE